MAPFNSGLEIQNRINNHLLAEERPPVTNIRHNLLRNIPQSAATPWANYGRDAPTAPPPALPPVTPHSSCLQEAAAGATPHITPVKSHFSYLCFLRSLAAPTATKPRQGNEDDRQKKKTEQEQQTAQKQTKKTVYKIRVKARGLLADSANSSAKENKVKRSPPRYACIEPCF